MSGIDFRIHQVSYSEVDANGFIGIQFDAFGEQGSGMPTIEVHSPYGFFSRPVDPGLDADGNPLFGCNVLVGWEGDEAHAWLLSDPRSRPVTAVLQQGESMMFGVTGNFCRMHADGRISLFTTDDATPNGKTVALQIKPDGFLFSAPWGKITFDATGFHVLHISGAALDLGAIGGLPTPLDAISSYVKLTAGMVQREASIIADGTVAGLASAVAKSDPVLAALGSASTAFAAVATAMTAVAGTVPPPGDTAAVAAAATLATAIGVLVSALTAAEALIPSSSSSVT